MSEEYELTMPPRWHSSHAAVHHDDNRCLEGRVIKLSDLRSGSGGRPLCAKCESLGEPAASRLSP